MAGKLDRTRSLACPVLALLSTVGVGCSVLRGPAARQLPLAAEGRPAAVIVVPPEPPHPVRFAAEELRYFLERMTGAGFDVVNQVPESGTAILLGEDLARAAGIDASGLVRDGYLIKTLGPHIHIVGVDDRSEKSEILFTVKDGPLPPDATQEDRYGALADVPWDFERGTLHGVYHFLEALGVRWFFPGPKGTVVPAQSTVAVEALDVREEPYFLLRSNQRIILPLKQRVKAGQLNPEEYRDLGLNGRNQRLWMVRQRGSSRWMAFNHRPKRHQWSARFGKERPEYFALLADGTRAVGGGKERGYLNYTSEGVFRETLKDMEAYFSGQPPSARGLTPVAKFAANRGWAPNASYADTFSLLPNDGLKVDRSEASQPFLHEDMPFPHRHSDYVWQFVEKVAREAKVRFPGKKLVCFAYQTYWEIPQSVESLPDNVIVGIAALSGCSRMSTSVDQAKYGRFLDLLERWSRLAEGPLFFWHYSLYRHNQGSLKGVPMVLPRHAAKVFRDLAKYGRYIFMQNDFDNIMFDHVNRYVYSRLMWNPHADVEAILDDYARSFYGPAAPVMKNMLDDVEARCTKIAAASADAVAIWETFFTEEALLSYRQAVTEAERLTSGGPHAEAVRLMSVRFLAEMEKQRAGYVRDVKKLRDEGADILKVRRAQRPIVVDGKLSEKEWLRTGGRPLRNNVDGRGTRLPARVRLRYAPDRLYCSFDIASPTAREQLAAGGRKDFVEVFLDVNGDRYTYYWIQIDPAGAVKNHFYPGAGEPPDVNWDSRAEVTVEVGDKGWTVEMAVPFEALQATPKAGQPATWSGNFCLTRFDARGTKDMFSSANPLLRGRFHQPGLFARLVFEE